MSSTKATDREEALLKTSGRVPPLSATTGSEIERDPEESSAAAGPGSGTKLSRSVHRVLRTFGKRLLPAAVLAKLRIAEELRTVSNSRRQRLASVMRASRRSTKKPALPLPTTSVVFVCHGNIMRSPVAEAMLKQELQKRGEANLVVISAGLHAVAGRSADPRSVKVAPEFGISVIQHRARPLNQNLVDTSDLVVVMDTVNAAEFLLLYPKSSEKLFFLRQFSVYKQADGCDIPDPYPGDEQGMRDCCRILRECVEGLAARLAVNTNRKPPV
jgi:protein-tyrosine phosphatase